MHEATLSGRTPPRPPRSVIAESWRRALGRGVDPDRGGERTPLAPEELDRHRETSGLLPALPALRAGLTSIADEALHIMVVVGADGRVLWREGSSAVRRRADSLGFVEGAAWDEDTVGTNAIGTALVARRPVQVYSAEHYVRTHHVWTCAAAPVHDPRSGRLLGVVDVSGPAATVHASTLALVDAVAHLAQNQLRADHRTELERLRAVAAPMLARIEGRAVVTDRHGWLVAATGLAPTDRIMLPDGLDGETTWLPAYGACRVEPIPGGWLIRTLDDAGGSPEPTRVVLDLRHRPAQLIVRAPSGTWEHALSPRHADLLRALAERPAGSSAADLAQALFGDAARTVTVRAEMSRLRRHLGGVLAHRPYRFADWVQVEVLTAGT
ncbi:MAG: GAF domain-containing protein [Kineosporiaceae bacterium]|nr:GAF domain-containing protein [Kineosporiaceae bacterium]MBK7621157.1 GAF domain-containing protein [Kineosporiaceae bacterium]MBK8076010.1 GAF domain-containing protein [Kineosporiaceae bacterium]